MSENPLDLIILCVTIYFFLDLQKKYEDDVCYCTETSYGLGPWCDTWRGSSFQYCTLNGKGTAKFCPGARRYADMNEYYTLHPKVCEKSIREYLI